MPNIEGINIQQSSAERKSYVVVGAILSCSSGSKQSRLKMPFSHGVFVKGKPQMNIMDFVPNVNIMPFGKCSSLQNPTVASATAANNGVLKPMPCTPLTTMPWIDGKADKMVGGHPALLNKSTNMCFYCGQIKIEDDGQDLGGVTIGNQSSTNSGPSAAGFGQGPACEKPQEKPSMWDNFVKGISMLGDVPAAMQKAASELPGALEKAANDLPKGLKKAAEDLPKGIEVFVKEGFIEPMQEDLDTLRDEDINLEDALAISGLAVHALTLGRSKNVKDIVNALKKGKKGTGKAPVPTKPGGGSNPKDFVNPHSEKHLYDPSRPSTPNRSQYGKDVDVEKLRLETMTNSDKAFSNWPNPNNPNPNRITKYYKEFDGNISTPDTPTGSHRVFEHLDDPTRSSHFPYVPRNKE
ncbi:DUF4280 domain-containing protein [Brevibacillus brevis]|nr:DUF4280 domain-containing protein [Brevibacillus brevis]